MTFAGLTSAYIVSAQRPDWNIEFNFPSLFYWSTIIIILSSLTFWISKKMLKKGVIVRAMRGYKLPEWIRVSIGTKDENMKFLELLRSIIIK